MTVSKACSLICSCIYTGYAQKKAPGVTGAFTGPCIFLEKMLIEQQHLHQQVSSRLRHSDPSLPASAFP